MALDVRAAAARVLGNTLAGQSLNQSLPPLLEKVGERDRALLRQLCYGSLRDAPRLLACLDLLLEKPLRDKDRDVRGLLLCGLHQLDGMRVPDHAAVAATVGATRALKKPWARGLTNALLRRYLREREELWQTLDEAATASHPDWLYRSLHEQWPTAAAAMIAANNLQPPMTLRVNCRVNRDDCLRTLDGQGIAARAGTLSPETCRTCLASLTENSACRTRLRRWLRCCCKPLPGNGSLTHAPHRVARPVTYSNYNRS